MATRRRSSSGADDCFARRQSAIGRHPGDVPLDPTPSRTPRRNAAKPPSCAWTVSQRAGRSPALRNEWATPGGAGYESSGRDPDRLAFAPDLERQLALEDVERIGVPAVN